MKKGKAKLGLLLFLLTWWIFYSSPVFYLSDSSYSMLMDEAILHHGTPNMIAYQVPQGSGLGFYGGYPWQLAMLKGRLLYTFPWGGALLSLPAVAVLNALGFDVAPHHVYTAANEAQVQRILSPLLCAIVVWVLYEAAIAVLPIGWSLALSSGAAFGTQIWSSASRSLWPQTWYLLLISLAIVLLVRDRIRPVLLGTLLAWACLVRPVAVPTVAIISVYILLECGSNNWLRVAYVSTGACWALIFTLMMLFFTDRLLPYAYHAEWFLLQHGFLQRLRGVLFSPSRGLLIYMPVLFLPLCLTLRYWQNLPKRRLVILALLVIVSTIAVVASYGIWWSGWSYGPRDLVDIVPWFVVLTILGVRAFLDDSTLTMQQCSAVISTAIVLLAVSVAMNAPGALSSSASNWNAVPNVDEHPERLWDWEHPQWLAWAQSR